MDKRSLTLEQLRIFIGVAEREHMTRAAESLNVTQSAASTAISALEARHGVKLFHRIGRRIELTEAGRTFLDEARAVLVSAENAERTLSEFTGLTRGTLKLVASQTIASYWLPPKLAVFHARYPQVEIELAIANTEGAVARVLDGSAELGFAEGQVDEPAIAVWPIAEDRLRLVAAPDVTAPDEIDETWLAEASWVVRERGSGTRSSFEAALAERGFDPARLNISLTLPANEAVLTSVAAGAGVAVLSELVVACAVASGRLKVLSLPLPARPYYGIRHKERYRSRAADALLGLIKEL